MQCPSCGANFSDTNRFCPSCGAPAQTQQIKCSSCGQPVRAGVRFCTTCGASVGTAVSTERPYVDPQKPTYSQPSPLTSFEKPERERKGNQALFWAPFVVLLFIGILFFGIGKVSIAGWIVLAAVFALMFFLRKPLLKAGAVATLGSWAVALVALFLALGITATSSRESAGMARGASSTPAPTSGVASPTQVPAVASAASKATTASTTTQPTPVSTAAKPQPISAQATATTAPTSTAKVQAIALGLGIDQQFRITNPTTTFKPDTPEIFISYEVRDVTRETSVEVHWTFLGSNEVIKQEPIKITNDRRMSGSLTKPTKGFPVGEFKVNVLLDGRDAGSINFSVAGGTAQAPSNIKLQNITSGLGLDQTQKITSPTNQFKPNTPEICFSAEFVDLQQNTAADIQLFYLPTGDNIKGPTQKLNPASGVSRVGWSFSIPNNGWPTGKYKATFSADGKEVGSLEFSVQP